MSGVVDSLALYLGFKFFSCSYVKRIINWIKHKEETEEDVYTRWEKDFDLIALDKHGLFSEYLELGESIQARIRTHLHFYKAFMLDVLIC